MPLHPEFIRFSSTNDSTPTERDRTETEIEWKSLPSQNWLAALGKQCSHSTPDTWFVLADNASGMKTLAIEPLVSELQRSQSEIHVLPWQGLHTLAPHADPLFLWKNCSPRIAALWSNPGPQVAVAIRNAVLQSAISNAMWPSNRQPNQRTEASSASEIVWEILLRAMELDPKVSATAPPRENSLPVPGQNKQECLPPLVPGQMGVSRAWLKELIVSQKPAYFASRLQSQADAVALKAGLCQWHGWLAESHQLAQSIEGLGRNRAGDYWHAIHHRREPDFSNARYWVRQLRSHPVFQALSETVPHFPDFQLARTWAERLIKRGKWDPPGLCRLVRSMRDSAEGIRPGPVAVDGIAGPGSNDGSNSGHGNETSHTGHLAGCELKHDCGAHLSAHAKF